METALAIPTNLTSTTVKYIVLAMLHALIFIINIYWAEELMVQYDQESKEVKQEQVEALHGRLLNGSFIDFLESELKNLNLNLNLNLLREMTVAGRD